MTSPSILVKGGAPGSTRMVVINIDDLLRIIKDILPEEDLPKDSIPVRLLYRPTDRGKIGIEVESPSFSPLGGAELNVKFDLKRIHSV